MVSAWELWAFLTLGCLAQALHHTGVYIYVYMQMYITLYIDYIHVYIIIYTWCILYIHLILYRHKSNVPFLLLKSSMKSQHASTWMGSTSQVTLRESLLGWTKTVRPDDGREVMGTAFCRGNAAQNDPNFQIGGRKLHIRYVRYVSWLKEGKSWGGLHSFCARWQKVHPMTRWQLEAYGWPYHRDRLVDTTGGDHFWTLDVSGMTPEAPIASPSLSKSLRSMGIGLVGRGGDLFFAFLKTVYQFDFFFRLRLENSFLENWGSPKSISDSPSPFPFGHLPLWLFQVKGEGMPLRDVTFSGQCRCRNKRNQTDSYRHVNDRCLFLFILSDFDWVRVQARKTNVTHYTS